MVKLTISLRRVIEQKLVVGDDNNKQKVFRKRTKKE